MKLNIIKPTLIATLAAAAAMSFAQQSSTVNGSTVQSTSITKNVDLFINFYLSVSFADDNALSYTVTNGGQSGSYTIGTANYNVTTNFNTGVSASVAGDLSGTGGTFGADLNGVNSFPQGSLNAAGTVTVSVNGLSINSTPSTLPYTGTLTLTFTQA
jgi:hypothetical protein